MPVLQQEEYNPYYSTYIDKVSDNNLISALERGFKETLIFFESIPINKWNYSYSEGKWTVKEVIQHILDTERVFAYRALCIARNDKTELPGFDQDDYASGADANDRNAEEMIAEYKAIRMTTINLFKSFNKEMFLHIGVASNSPLSTRAAGFIIAGHEKHHCDVVQERYL